MADWKRWRGTSCAPEALVSVAETEWALPADVLLEIITRSDITTFVTFAVACKALRRDILDPSFIRRVTGGIVPRCFLAYLNAPDEKDDPPPPAPLSLVHPVTSAAASFLDVYLSPFLSPFADELLREYYPIISRGTLLLLERCHVSTELPNLCVFDLITGQHTFLPYPPGVDPDRCFDRYVLLTASDGIGCSFLLFVSNIDNMHNENDGSTIEVHTATSLCATWASGVTSHNNSGFFLPHWESMYRQVVILEGGDIHWLVRDCYEIASYNVCTMEQRLIKLPAHITNFTGQLYLGSYYSHDGLKLLRLFGIDDFKISLWQQLPSGYWESEGVMIDIVEKLRSLDTNNGAGQPFLVVLKYFGEGSNTVLLHVHVCRFSTTVALPIVIDLNTKEMRLHRYPDPSSMALEVDLPSRLQAMKLFP